MDVPTPEGASIEKKYHANDAPRSSAASYKHILWSLLNKRGAQYIGRVFPLHTAIVNGQGKIKVDDTVWKVQGEDCDINTKVKVVGIRGTVFDVERVG